MADILERDVVLTGQEEKKYRWWLVRDLLEMGIVLAIIAFIAVIYIPQSIWNEESDVEEFNRNKMLAINKILDFYKDFTGETTDDALWAIQVVNAVRDSVVADSLFSNSPRKLVLDGREIEVTVPKSFIWMLPDRRLGENPLSQHVRYITRYDTALGNLGVRKDTIVDEVYSVVVENRSEDPDNPDTWFLDTSFIRSDRLNMYLASLDTFLTKYVGIAETSKSEHVEVIHFYDRFRPDESILKFPIGEERYIIRVDSDNVVIKVPDKDYSERRFFLFTFDPDVDGDSITNGNASWIR
ncbi:MAG: hypothetical protein ACE5EE_00925 [Fidelibacterota bacterium]